mmetsp:Transcript_17016/g.14948  ORF Transcript_17016/g.14948 Transcript_17016/m.14948 type:complete len:411 (-) Transcript_17016:117-1349(-)
MKDNQVLKRNSISSDNGSIDTDYSEKEHQSSKTKADWIDILKYSHVAGYTFLNYAFFYYGKNVHWILWVFYVLVPGLDMIFKPDTKNLTNSASKEFEKDKRFLIPLYLFIINDYFNFFWSIYQFTYGDFNGIFHRIIFIYSQAHIASIGLVVGHELLHRRETIHKIFGTLEYSKIFYSHFFIEHVKGHHKHVATPSDSATSRLGESLFQFIPRTISGSYKSVWGYETQRLSKKDLSPIMELLSNRLVLFNIGHFLWISLLTYHFGTLGLIFMIVYAMFGILMLETINYIEHYGLRRDKDENGIYEPINIKHSWNAPHRYTNYLLFKLQRHSDHHANSYKPYQILNSFGDSPTMVGGYSLALITSYCPPVWFKIYNPLAKAAQEEKKIDESYSETISFRYYVTIALLLTAF